MNYRTNFPIHIGAVDGKQIELVNPHNIVSLYNNYKNYFCIILMVTYYESYCFILIVVDAYVEFSDFGVFKNTGLKKL